MTNHCTRSIAGLVAFAFAGLVLSAAVHAQQAPQSGSQLEYQQDEIDPRFMRSYVLVRSSVDRSAIWIGDRFSFTVTIECSNGTDILTDDLSRDRLQTEELEILGVEETREDLGDGLIIYRFVYHLTTYSFFPALKNIGEMTFRYYVRRPGQRLEDIVPAGELIVPGASIVVRSLLPDDLGTAEYRYERRPPPRPTALTLLQPIGIGLVIVSFVPVVLWGIAVLRAFRHRQRRQSARRLRLHERAALDELRTLDVEAEAERRTAYDRLSALVRDHVTGAWGVSADGLTPDEIGLALSAQGLGDVSAEAVQFLDTCDKARYGRPEELPTRDACRAAVDQAEQLIGLGPAA
jgi:hypothetical protein